MTETMTDNATYDELLEAINKAIEYGHRSFTSDIVRRQFKAGKRIVYRRVNTPDGIPTFYIFAIVRQYLMFRTFIVLDSKEGESFAGRMDGEKLVYVIHGHAINRYCERKKFTGTLEQARRNIINGLMINDVQKDSTDETRYIYFDGGVFLCTLDDGVLHLRTYILNRQCSTMQRMKSLKSEQETKEYKRELGIYETR